MSENRKPVLLVMQGEDKKKYEETINRSITLWADHLTREQREFLTLLVTLHGYGDSLKFLADKAAHAQTTTILKSTTHLLYDLANRWARKGGTMSEAHFREVYDLLERVATEVREHLENVIDGS